MELICAWCQKKLESKSDEPIEGQSHGICPDCAAMLLEDDTVSYYSFVDTLGYPIAIVDSDSRIAHINPIAQKMLNKTNEQAKGHLGGDVFECIHSYEPEGCGGTIHCTGCTIRNSVTQTRETGTPARRVPAKLNTKTDSIDLYISTWKKDDIVMLLIETPDEVNAA